MIKRYLKKLNGIFLCCVEAWKKLDVLEEFSFLGCTKKIPVFDFRDNGREVS